MKAKLAHGDAWRTMINDLYGVYWPHRAVAVGACLLCLSLHRAASAAEATSVSASSCGSKSAST